MPNLVIQGSGLMQINTDMYDVNIAGDFINKDLGKHEMMLAQIRNVKFPHFHQLFEFKSK